MQTKKGSALEAAFNVLSGFFISWAVWVWIVAPLYGYETGYGKAIGITAIFTVSSLIRSYIWRRIFNHRSRKCT